MTQTKEIILAKGTYNQSDVDKITKLTKKQKEIILNDIVNFSKKFLKEAYGLELTIPIVINGRLSSCEGYFAYNRRNNKRTPLRIEFSERYLALSMLDAEDGILSVIQLVKHELIHYACFMLNKPFSDGDEYFENELLKHGSSASGTTRKSLVKACNSISYRVVDVYEINGVERRFSHTRKDYSNARQTRVGYIAIKSIYDLSK